jgi:hypothetical protein
MRGAQTMTTPLTERPSTRQPAADSRRRHTFGAVPFPTRARFRIRLGAIGLGRWASLFTGACESWGPLGGGRSVP